MLLRQMRQRAAACRIRSWKHVVSSGVSDDESFHCSFIFKETVFTPFALSSRPTNIKRWRLRARLPVIMKSQLSWYDTRCCLSCAQKLTWVNLIYRTEPKLKKWKREKLKIETLGEFMESVLKKKRLWRDRFVEKEGFTPGVKEWGSDGWWQGETLENNLPSNSLTGLTVEFERIRASPTPEDLSIPSCESRLPTGHHHTWQAVTM